MANKLNTASSIFLLIGLVLIGFSVARTAGITGMITGTSTVTVSNDTTISMVVSTVAFGTMSIGQTNDTSDANPPAFQTRNDGNVFINLSINASSLWVNAPNPTTNYTYKCNNVSGNWQGCKSTSPATQTTYANMPTSATQFIWNLSFTSTNDTAAADINVTVPTDEGGGAKSSTVTFTSAYCNCG